MLVFLRVRAYTGFATINHHYNLARDRGTTTSQQRTAAAQHSTAASSLLSCQCLRDDRTWCSGGGGSDATL